MLVNNKLIVKDSLLNSGVYKMKCDNCEFVYVGQTGCNFEIRLKKKSYLNIHVISFIWLLVFLYKN